MAFVVLGDIFNLSCSLSKKNLCGVKDAVETLVNLYIVWLYYEIMKKREIFII